MRQDILSPLQKRMVQDLSVKMESFVNDPQNTSKVKVTSDVLPWHFWVSTFCIGLQGAHDVMCWLVSQWDVGGAFVGFHNDLLSSLVLTVWDESKEVASNAGNQEEFEQGLQ